METWDRSGGFMRPPTSCSPPPKLASQGPLTEQSRDTCSDSWDEGSIGKWHSPEITCELLSLLRSLDRHRDALDTKLTGSLHLGGRQVQCGPTAWQVGFSIPTVFEKQKPSLRGADEW